MSFSCSICATLKDILFSSHIILIMKGLSVQLSSTPTGTHIQTQLIHWSAIMLQPPASFCAAQNSHNLGPFSSFVRHWFGDNLALSSNCHSLAACILILHQILLLPTTSKNKCSPFADIKIGDSHFICQWSKCYGWSVYMCFIIQSIRRDRGEEEGDKEAQLILKGTTASHLL